VRRSPPLREPAQASPLLPKDRAARLAPCAQAWTACAVHASLPAAPTARRRAAGALERRREGDRQLRDHVEAEARDLAGEAFTRFMAELYKRIYHFISRRGAGGLGDAAACVSHRAREPRGTQPAVTAPAGGHSTLPRASFRVTGCACSGFERQRQCRAACMHASNMHRPSLAAADMLSAPRRSPDQSERLGGVLAIDELIDVKVRPGSSQALLDMHAWRRGGRSSRHALAQVRL